MNYVIYENDWWWGHSTTFVADDGKSMIELSVAEDTPDFGWLRCLMVHDSVQRKGRASEIMKFAEDEARLRDISCLGLAVNKSEWKKDWYLRLGFEEKGEMEDSGGKTIQMQKEL